MELVYFNEQARELVYYILRKSRYKVLHEWENIRFDKEPYDYVLSCYKDMKYKGFDLEQKNWEDANGNIVKRIQAWHPELNYLLYASTREELEKKIDRYLSDLQNQ